MGWGSVCLRGEVPNTSQTCCAFRRPVVSPARAARLPRPLDSKAGRARLSQRATEPFGCRNGALTTTAPCLEASGEGAPLVGRDALSRVLQLPSDRFPLALRLTRLTSHPETQSDNIVTLPDDLSPLTGNLAALSRTLDAQSGRIDALSQDINALSDDIFGLSGDIFTLTGDILGLSGDIFPQFCRSKPLTHSQLYPKYRPGHASATLHPQTHPSYA